MGRLLLLGIVAAMVIAVTCDEAVSQEDMSAMTKEKLVEELSSANDKIADLKRKLRKATGDADIDEKTREARERKNKDDEKKKEAAKREAKIQKKEKLSDILMNHGARYLAFVAAKKTRGKGSVVQKKAVRHAAKKGARAGAVGPLHKVARVAAVKAVKKVRAQAKKDHIRDKKKIRDMSKVAARAAVKKLLDEQEELVEKAVDKWSKAAMKKFPPTILLAEHDDKPNNFAAPPMIHLSLDDSAAGAQVAKLEEDTKKQKQQQEVATAASAAKQAAGKIVPEHN